MRALPFACLLLTLSAPAMAEDRYGPQNPAAIATSASAALPPTARLTWHGKVEPAAATPVPAASEPMRPLADGVLRRTGAYDAAPPVMHAPPPAPIQAAAVAPPAENAPWKRLLGPVPAQRAAAPAAMEAPAPVQAAAQAHPVQPVAVAAPIPAAQPFAAGAPQRTAAAAGDQARYYSLHREYGETPDAIPAPQKTQVFLAGGPLNSGVGEDEADQGESTGKTAAINKARIAADWRASAAQ